MRELYYVYSTALSPDLRGVFQLMRKKTQPAISQEDVTADE
jgi:hypothetical protein